MVNIKSLFIVGLVLFSLGADTIDYHIQPEFNKNTNQLTIDTLILEDASLINRYGDYDPKKKGKLQRLKESYIIKSSKCSKLRYSLMTAAGRISLTDNFETYLSKKSIQEDTSCGIIKIANIRMHQCLDNKRYYISTSQKAQSGGFSKREYIMLDQHCFQTMKNHFLQKAQEDKIEVIYTSTDKEPPINFMWQKGKKLNFKVSLEDGKNYCKELTLDGYTNWRLPTKKEYFSTPDGFFDIKEDTSFWTATAHHSDENIIWMQSLPDYDTASGYYDQKGKVASVQCVRDK